jgi:hypothetical protein
VGNVVWVVQGYLKSFGKFLMRVMGSYVMEYTNVAPELGELLQKGNNHAYVPVLISPGNRQDALPDGGLESEISESSEAMKTRYMLDILDYLDGQGMEYRVFELVHCVATHLSVQQIQELADKVTYCYIEPDYDASALGP